MDREADDAAASKGHRDNLSVDVSGRQFESPLGFKGQFYFDSIPAGRYPASVDFSYGTCKFEIENHEIRKTVA
jgi:hypothetical protein